MKKSEKWTRTERILLLLTLLFVVVTGVCFALRNSGGGEADYVVRSADIRPLPQSAEDDLPEEDEPEPPTAAHPLDLNEAGQEELELLPGIGPALAGRILDYRAEHGPFTKTEELINVSGIGEKTYAALRELVTVKEAAA